MSDHEPVVESRWRGLCAVVVVATGATLPAFAVGALSTPIEASLRVSSTGMGVALLCFFGGTAIASRPAARLAPRLPERAALAGIAAWSAATQVLIAVSPTWLVLPVLLALAGIANALIQPLAARIIRRDLPAGRLSLASGAVGAALGAAPLIPGVAVAVIDPVQWRWAMVVCAAATVIILVAATLCAGTPRRAAAQPTATPAGMPVAAPSGRRTVEGRILLVWAVAAALGTVGVNAAASFFVAIATNSSIPAGAAGVLLVVASVISVFVRLAIGATADRAPRRNPAMVAAMMFTGAVGLLVLSWHTPVSFIIGAFLAVSGGWGWTGLLLACALRLLPAAGPRAAAAIQAGLFSGAAAAPVIFGALSATLGIPATTAVAAVSSLAGAALVAVGAVLARRGAPAGTGSTRPGNPVFS